jgi:hypothetical protein
MNSILLVCRRQVGTSNDPEMEMIGSQPRSPQGLTTSTNPRKIKDDPLTLKGHTKTPRKTNNNGTTDPTVVPIGYPQVRSCGYPSATLGQHEQIRGTQITDYKV